MLQIKSIGLGLRASSISSTTLRAKACAAAAALKKVENYKRRSLAESQSSLNIQREELALAKRKLEEQARLEAVRLENVQPQTNNAETPSHYTTNARQPSII